MCSRRRHLAVDFPVESSEFTELNMCPVKEEPLPGFCDLLAQRINHGGVGGPRNLNVAVHGGGEKGLLQHRLVFRPLRVRENRRHDIALAVPIGVNPAILQHHLIARLLAVLPSPHLPHACPAPAQSMAPPVGQNLDRLETRHLVFTPVIEMDIVDVERRLVARWGKILDGRVPAQFVFFRVCQGE